MLRLRPWRRRRYGPCVDGDDCGRSRRPRHCDAALSISLHGKGQQAAGFAGSCPCGRAGRGGGSRAVLRRVAADRGRQIVRRPDDVAGAGAYALPGVRGLAFFAFPLHPAGKPSSDRAKHLADVAIPMLFLQGTRDALAELSLLEPVVKKLGKLATLHLVEGSRPFLSRAGALGPQRPRGDDRGAGCVRGVGRQARRRIALAVWGADANQASWPRSSSSIRTRPRP